MLRFFVFIFRYSLTLFPFIKPANRQNCFMLCLLVFVCIIPNLIIYWCFFFVFFSSLLYYCIISTKTRLYFTLTCYSSLVNHLLCTYSSNRFRFFFLFLPLSITYLTVTFLPYVYGTNLPIQTLKRKHWILNTLKSSHCKYLWVSK